MNKVQLAKNWVDYELLDFGQRQRLERWGKLILIRPDQNALGPTSLDSSVWDRADIRFIRDNDEQGHWEGQQFLEAVSINYKELTLGIKLTQYKHTGIFPEQAVNWDFITSKIASLKRSDLKVLNLFGYTGGASLAASKAGASEVVHIDSSKGAIQLAKTNQILSKLELNKIRFIVEDAKKYVEKEQRRGSKYDAIILDPPLYGRGPKGELWKIEKDLMLLLKNCMKILSDKPIFVLVNLYADEALSISTKVILNSIKYPGDIDQYTLGLPTKADKKILECGEVIRWGCN